MLSDDKLGQKREYLLAFIDIESEDHPERGAKVLEDIIKQDPLSARLTYFVGSLSCQRAKASRGGDAA